MFPWFFSCLCLFLSLVGCMKIVENYSIQKLLQYFFLFSSFAFFFLISLLFDWTSNRYKNQDEDLLPKGERITLSPNKIKCHHPNCPKVNSSSPNIEQRHTIKPAQGQQTVGETSSLTGSIVIPNSCNNSQLSSPELSDATETRKYLSAINLHDERDEKQKTILLKIPSVIKSDQPIVSEVLDFCFVFVFELQCKCVAYTHCLFFRAWRDLVNIWVRHHRQHDVVHRLCSTNMLYCMRRRPLLTIRAVIKTSALPKRPHKQMMEIFGE